jgi:hypothetical protein
VSRWHFFATFGIVRFLRYGVAAVLAHQYGASVLRVLESDTFRRVIIGFIVVAVLGTIV